jgi:hypothetical protein
VTLQHLERSDEPKPIDEHDARARSMRLRIVGYM